MHEYLKKNPYLNDFSLKKKSEPKNAKVHMLLWELKTNFLSALPPCSIPAFIKSPEKPAGEGNSPFWGVMYWPGKEQYKHAA